MHQKILSSQQNRSLSWFQVLEGNITIIQFSPHVIVIGKMSLQ